MSLHFTYFTFSHCVGHIVSKFAKAATVVSLLLVITTAASGQSSIDRTVACACIDNDAPLGNAQFMEEITVTSVLNDRWYMTNNSGFYQLSSPVPPELQIPFITGPDGDTLVANGDGTFSIEGLHIESVGYSLELTNGTDTVSLDNILCEFPAGEISGDFGICEGETNTYSVESPNSDYEYQWSISGQGQIVGPNNTSDFTVNWDEDGVGEEFITLTVTGDTGCSSTTTESIDFEEDITLACNNIIQITVSPLCIIELMPDDILESMKYDDESYEIVITDRVTGDIIPQGSLASDYLLDTLEVSILHACFQNSCWGYVIFEDKYVPPLVCENDTIRCDADDSPSALGFPLPSTANIIAMGDGTYLVEDFDPCGDATLEYSDAIQPLTCLDDFASITSRTWTLTDFSGSFSTCVQDIYKTRTTRFDVIIPGDYDGIDNPVLACNGNYQTLPNGNPSPNSTGFPTGGICDHISISYTDLISEICGAGFKVVRKWKIFDECADSVRLENQLIKIEDAQNPSFSCPSAQSFEVDGNSCESNVIVNLPNNVVDCSEVNFDAEIVFIDDFGNIAGPITEMSRVGNTFRSFDRQAGTHRITYEGTDECGNSSSCSFNITVYDGTPPIAVCDQATTIALDNTGSAIVPVSTFDNGSNDNCEIDRIEISRGPNACGASSGFGPSITLCCADANQDVMVTLRVTDVAGNVNTCMVMVAVQDKKVPVLNVPANTSVPCYEDYTDLTQFGSATAEDNCTVFIDEVVDHQVNNCGVGTILRTFTATDVAGNEVSGTQIINIVNDDPFTVFDIVWPADYTSYDCVSPELDPDDLPFNNRRPQITTKACSDPVADYSDKVFTNASGACKTIFRTWTVLDQCTDNQFDFIQKLYIDDSQVPSFDECSNKTLTGDVLDDCNYAISYSKSGTDNCTTPDDLAFNFSIDLFNDNVFDIDGTGAISNMSLPVGEHRILWSIIDDCNNSDNCIEIITIEDTKKPTPYCLGGISTVVMPSTGSIAIWASDFNLASEDNCTDSLGLRYAFSPNVNNTSITFTCEDLEGMDEKFFTLEVHVFDEAGNFDFCTTTIRINANDGCPMTGTVTFEGEIETEDNEKMESVEVRIQNVDAGFDESYTTDENGLYAFTNLSTLTNYQVSASYEDDPLNGITTLDVILIQKHILGLQVLDSPYKIIAADVNASQGVTGADIVQLRKLILGFYDEFPASPSWRVIPQNGAFENPLSPWPLTEELDVVAIEDLEEHNFVSVKIGDVNLSRQMSLLSDGADTRNKRTNELMYRFEVEDGDLVAYFEFEEEKEILGFQFDFESDLFASMTAFEPLYPRDATAEMLFSQDMDHFAVSFSGAFAQKVKSLFRINFGPTSPSKILLNREGMKSELYAEIDQVLEAESIILSASGPIDQKNALQVYQNYPNPFHESTEIPFYLPSADQVVLVVRNVNGKEILRKTNFFEEGNNTIIIRKEEVDQSNMDGVLLYTISSSTERVSKKMITLK